MNAPFTSTGLRVMEPPASTAHRLSDPCLDDLSIIECLREAARHFEASVARILATARVNDHGAMIAARVSTDVPGAIADVFAVLDQADELLVRNDEAQGGEP